MKVLEGTPASPGIAIGTGCLYTERSEEKVPHYIISPEKVEEEIARLERAYEKASETIKDLNAASRKMFGKQGEEIFDMHGAILGDISIRDRSKSLISENLVNAEHAAYDAFTEYATHLKKGKSRFDEIAQDVIDVRNRLIASFTGTSGEFVCPVGVEQAVVVVAKKMTPSMVLSIPKEHVLAFVTDEGGFTTHATILARNYGVPIVFNVDTEDNINCGDNIIVDGSRGKVIVSPDTATLKKYSQETKKASQRKLVCEAKKLEPSKTGRGARITLKCNISTPNELEMLGDINYDGVGLLRSEFIFPGKTEAPEEDEWASLYTEAVERAGGKSVVIRLIDVGGDKLPGYLSLPPQENPDLGIRGARAIEIFGDVYLAQVKGILRAAVHGDARVLFPMVSDISDVKAFREIVDKARKSLRREGKKFTPRVKQGVMIEVPSAALMAESILGEVDFANIGSNDLVQYTLAAARGNQLIEKRYHILHPSIVKLMEIVVKAGKKHKKEVCLCGEIADFEEFYPILLALGLRSFSVAAAKLDDMKCYLLHQKIYPKTVLDRYYSLRTKKEIDMFFAQDRKTGEGYRYE